MDRRIVSLRTLRTLREVFFGGLRPRPEGGFRLRKRFNGGAVRLRRTKTSANQRGGRAFHVLKILGCFRRKALPAMCQFRIPNSELLRSLLFEPLNQFFIAAFFGAIQNGSFDCVFVVDFEWGLASVVFGVNIRAM